MFETVNRLKISHGHAVTHMYCKFMVGESEMYLCNADIMTAEHLLQHCQLHYCSETEHVARTSTTEGQALWQRGGAEEDSYFREGDRHLRLAYDEEEARGQIWAFVCWSIGCLASQKHQDGYVQTICTYCHTDTEVADQFHPVTVY